MTEARPGPGDSAELIRLAARHLAGVWRQPVRAGQLLAATPGHAVFRCQAPGGQEVVVKADLSPRRPAAERTVLAAAGAAGLPVPRIVYTAGGGSGGPALLALEHVCGTPLSPAAPGAAWADAGRVLSRLHDLPDPGGLPVTLDWRANWGGRSAPAAMPARSLRETLPGLAAAEAADAASRGLLTGPEAAALDQLLSTAFRRAAEPDRCRVLHGDAQPGHFLLAARAGAGPGPVAALIDFGDTALGDPVWDLAVLTLDDRDRLGDVLAGYAPGPALAERVHRTIGSYWLLRWLAEANWLHEFGYDPAQNIAMLRRAAGQAVSPG